MGRTWILIALLACVAVGSAGALDARAFLIVPAACALGATCVLAYRRPDRALPLAMLIVLLAGTKFRNRDPTASLTDTVDGLIVLELGLYAIIALILLVTMLSPAFHSPKPGTMERLLIAFAAFALGSALWSEAPTLTVVRAAQLCILLALGFVAVRVLDVPGALHAMGGAIMTYVLACAAITIVVPSTRVLSKIDIANERFTWFAMHSISASTFTAIAMLYLLCITLFVSGGWRRQRLGMPSVLWFVPLTTIMIATNSRGPLFALIGASAAVVMVRYFHPVTSLTLAAASSTLVLAATLLGITPSSLLMDVSQNDPRLSEIVLRGQTASEFGTLTGRTELWADLIPLYLERPIAGYGYQGSRSAMLRVRSWAGHAHNALLQTLMDVGLVGALLIWIPFMRALFVRPQSRAPTTPGTAAWTGAAIFAFSMFILLDSVSDASFAGPPGYELLLMFCIVMATERLAHAVARETSRRADRRPVRHRVAPDRAALVAPGAHRGWGSAGPVRGDAQRMEW